MLGQTPRQASKYPGTSPPSPRVPSLRTRPRRKPPRWPRSTVSSRLEPAPSRGRRSPLTDPETGDKEPTSSHQRQHLTVQVATWSQQGPHLTEGGADPTSFSKILRRDRVFATTSRGNPEVLPRLQGVTINDKHIEWGSSPQMPRRSASPTRVIPTSSGASRFDRFESMRPSTKSVEARRQGRRGRTRSPRHTKALRSRPSLISAASLPRDDPRAHRPATLGRIDELKGSRKRQPPPLMGHLHPAGRLPTTASSASTPRPRWANSARKNRQARRKLALPHPDPLASPSPPKKAGRRLRRRHPTP